MSSVLIGYLRLMRPANLPTAAADICAGVALAGLFSASNNALPNIMPIIFLVFSSVFLYAGGVVLNDVFDVEVDKIERPERAIPSGLIPLKSAAIFGAILLLMGISMAFLVNNLSGIIAVLLAFSIVLYDGFSKKYNFLGPLNMGLCRSLNLLLGISVLMELVHWEYALIPLVYIFAITLISRGEVHGNNKNHILWAGLLYAAVIISVVIMATIKSSNVLQTLPFLVLFTFLVYKPLVGAYKHNSPENIKKAVIGGVLALIVLDAAIAAGHATWWYAILLLLLLPLSIFLSKLFAVT